MKMSELTFLRLLVSLGLLCFTDFGDFLESRPFVIDCRRFHAILDNMIHIWIGIFTWTVFSNNPWTVSQELVTVALGAGVIDLDHFLVARSISVDNAIQAGHRGLFHCSGLAILIAVILLKYRPHAALLFLVAVIPHHLRDSQRRGLYIFPFHHEFDIPPVNKFLVRILLPIFPWTLLYFQKYFNDNNSNELSSARTFNV